MSAAVTVSVLPDTAHMPSTAAVTIITLSITCTNKNQVSNRVKAGKQ